MYVPFEVKLNLNALLSDVTVRFAVEISDAVTVSAVLALTLLVAVEVTFACPCISISGVMDGFVVNVRFVQPPR